jgi:alpha-mannosidase
MPTTATESRPADATFTAEHCHFWVVPHTHWDREWYLPLEQFRMLLARTVDELLDVLDADDRLVFTLDGQTIVVDDYLQLRPERRDQLVRLIDSGRVAIGPCYILPDQFLVGAESHVRNLLAGREDCRRFGARPMMVGYVPDAFGHTAQFPQILRGFGIDNFLFGRGMGSEWRELGMAFDWRGPDGSSVMALPLPDSYHNAFKLGYFEISMEDGWAQTAKTDSLSDSAARHIRILLERHRSKYESSELYDVILCNGVDHLPIQRDLPDVLDQVTELLPGAAFDIVTYERYVETMRGWANGRTLPTFHGELLGGLEQNVLRGVNSARMYLKQANEHAEVSLGTAETLANLAAMKLGVLTARTDLGAGPDIRLGVEGFSQDGLHYHFPRAELRNAWRMLMTNHPHDSICGCSVDEVHTEMMQRFASVDQIVQRIAREALTALSGADEPWTYVEAPMDKVSVVNALPWKRHRVVALPLSAKLRGARSLEAVVDGTPVPAQIVDVEARRCALVALDVDGFGAMDVALRKAKSATASPSMHTGDRWIDNSTLRVTAHDNGTLDVLHHASGRQWTGLHLFEDAADRGDEYNFDPIAGETLWTSASETPTITVSDDGPSRATLRIELTARLPKGLARGRDTRAKSLIPCRIVSDVSLHRGGDRVEFVTTVDNRVTDHRLRVLFPSGSRDTTVRAEQHFTMVERPLERAFSSDWVEPPQPTEHTIGLVATNDIATMTKGLPEYQAYTDPTTGTTTIAVTLLRCVEWLSRDDLSTRPKGHAGPGILTPEAQCLGRHHFEYAFAPLAAEASNGQLMCMSQDFRSDFAVGPAGASTDGVLTIDANEVVFTALKDSEDGSGARILRVFNPTVHMQTATVATDWTLQAVRMDEQGPDERINVDGQRVTIPAHAVATIRLEPDE